MANPVIPPPVLSQPVFPYSYAQCWLNSTYVFKPIVTDISGATLFYQWQLNSGSGPVNIPGATNANLAFLGIPGLAVGNTVHALNDRLERSWGGQQFRSVFSNGAPDGRLDKLL